VRTSLKDRKKQYRIIYEELSKSHRIKVNRLSSVLRINPNSASRRLREAFELGYVTLPQIRRRSYANMKEYMYFVRCENPLKLFRKYKDDTNVVYLAVMGGFANMWLITKEEIDVAGIVLVFGYHSDYHVSHAPDRLWERAIEIMWQKAMMFHPEEYNPKEIIKTHWSKVIEWDEEDEILFREFKYNARKKLTPIMRNNLISSQKTYEFLDRLPECCTVFTRYFPESKSAYDPYLFMFETDYEDFLIDLFSQLPTSSFFFKVSDKLFVDTHVASSSVRKSGVDMSDISRLHIPLLAEYLQNRGIIRSEAHSMIEYYWGKDL
jgi:hypothetical protein